MRISDWSSDVCSSDLCLCGFNTPSTSLKLIRECKCWHILNPSRKSKEERCTATIFNHYGSLTHLTNFIYQEHLSEGVITITTTKQSDINSVSSVFIVEDRKSTRLNSSH